MASKRGELEDLVKGMRVRHDRRVLLQIARKEAEELDAAISTIESEHARLCRLWHMKEIQTGILTDQLQQEVEPVKDAADRMDPRNDAGGKCYFDRKTGGSSWDVPDEMRQGLDTPSAVKVNTEKVESPLQKQQSWGDYDSPPPTPDRCGSDVETPAPAAPRKAPPIPRTQHWRPSKRHATQSAIPPCKRRAGDSPPDSTVSSYGLDDYDSEEAAVEHATTTFKSGPAAWQSRSPRSSSRPYGLAAPAAYPPPLPKRHAGGANPYGSPYSPLGLNRPGAPAWQNPYSDFLSRPYTLGPVPPHLPLAPPRAPGYS